jgi:PPP family 3-phenylpropionic acid transporter
LFWALGVAAEVAIFVVMHRWQTKHSVVQIMLIALLLTAVRWCLIGVWSESLGILILAQCLHAMSFGAMHAAAIHFVHERFSAHEQGKAQALYSSLSFGLGGAIGAIVSAFVVVRYGYASAFLFSALVSFSAYVVLALARKYKILH